MVSINERRWLVCIFSLYMLLAVGYSLLMPIWEAPDEPAHYHLAWHLAEHDRYPTLKLNYEASQPQTYYYFGSLVIRALDQINPRFSDYYIPPEFKQNIRVPVRRFYWNPVNYHFLLGVHILRWINIIFGALALWLNWKAFQVIAPDSPTLTLSALALAALTPQYLHIMSSVNNDALGTLAGAILFYLTLQVVNEQAKLFDLVSIALALILPFTTKLTVLPLSAALLVMVARKWFIQLHYKRWWIISGLVITLSAGIFYFLFPDAIQPAASEISWRLFSLRENALTSAYLTFILSQIVWTFWGEVGWLAVSLPAWIVNPLTLAWFIGVFFNMRLVLKTKGIYSQFDLWVATWLTALFTIGAVIRNGLTTSASQGRFLFPAIGSLMILMISGWHDILPERIRHILPLTVVLLMLGSNILLWLTGILPVYYQPFLD